MMESTRMLSLAEDDGALATLDAPPASARRASADAPDVERIARTVFDLIRAERQRSRIVVRSERRLLFLRQDEIDWVEAAGNYVRLHVGGETHVLRQSMKNMETRLDEGQFVRIHRSAIVNVERIRELQPWLHGEYVVVLADGTRLSASRVFSDRLDALIA